MRFVPDSFLPLCLLETIHNMVQVDLWIVFSEWRVHYLMEADDCQGRDQIGGEAILDLGQL